MHYLVLIILLLLSWHESDVTRRKSVYSQMLYMEATAAEVNAQGCKGVWLGQDLQAVWYCLSEAAVRWGDGALS